MIGTRVWNCYHTAPAALFLTKLSDLKAWATQTLEPGPGLAALLKLCDRAPAYAQAYEHPSAYRTSNMLDRPIDRMDRCFDSGKSFHGHLMPAAYGVRSWALLHNFQPDGPRTQTAATYQSPALKLNGLVDHDNWLQNLLVSESMDGFRQ